MGSRRFDYIVNNALVSNSFWASPQHLTPSTHVSPYASPASGNLVAHYAKESRGKIAVGIVDLGYKG